MIYTRDAVIDHVMRKIAQQSQNILVTSERLRDTSKFPAVEIRQTDKNRSLRNITLDFNDVQFAVTYTVQVYCDKASGGLVAASSVMDLVESCFDELYFIELSRNEIDNIDPSIARISARFRRQISDGDNVKQ